MKNGRVIAPITGILALPGLLSGELVRILPDYEISESPQLYALYLDRLASIPKLKIFLYFIEQVVKRLTKSGSHWPISSFETEPHPFPVDKPANQE